MLVKANFDRFMCSHNLKKSIIIVGLFVTFTKRLVHQTAHQTVMMTGQFGSLRNRSSNLILQKKRMCNPLLGQNSILFVAQQIGTLSRRM